MEVEPGTLDDRLRLLTSIEIGMTLTGQNHLAEGPLLRELGHLRWEHLSRIAGVPSRHLVDADGERLYATFFFVDIVFPRARPLSAFGENDRWSIASTIERHARDFIDGVHYLLPYRPRRRIRVPATAAFARRAGIPCVRMTNAFVRQMKGADWLKRSAPAADGIDRIPERGVPDVFPLLSRVRADQAPMPVPADFQRVGDETLLTGYQLTPERDLNGAGLVYFANFPVIADMCERMAIGAASDRPADVQTLLGASQLVHRRHVYFANASARDTVQASVDCWWEADADGPEAWLHIDTRLHRSSDGRLMYACSARRLAAAPLTRACFATRRGTTTHAAPDAVLARTWNGGMADRLEREEDVERGAPNGDRSAPDGDRGASIGRDDRDAAYHRLASGVSWRINGTTLELQLPDGRVLNAPAGAARIAALLDRDARGMSLGALKQLALAAGMGALVDELMAAGALVATGKTEDFEPDGFAALLRRPESRDLVVQFRGGSHFLVGGVPAHEFAEATGIAKHSLLMLRDVSGRYYLDGVSKRLSSFAHLMAWIDGIRWSLHNVDGLERLHCIGHSMGGFAALLAGHALGGQTVWAFSPALPSEDFAERLVSTLSAGNGRTRYRIWYGSQHDADRQLAERLAACPGVSLEPVATASHRVTSEMWITGTLPRLIEPPGHRLVLDQDGQRPDGATARIADVVRLVGEVLETQAAIEPGMSLDGLLDSFAQTRLFAAIERRWRLRLDMSAIAEDDLDTPERLLALINRTVSAAPAGTSDALRQEATHDA